MTETPKQAARRLLEGKIAKGYQPAALHAYTNADGQAIYYRARMEHPEGDAAPEGRKIIRPLYLNGSGYRLGEPAFPQGKKPIYNLDRIAADDASPVWVVEGEKAADALTKIGVVCTTSGSAESAMAADWSPLARRHCILWPDNDDAGRAYIGDVATALQAIGCVLEAIDIDGLALPPKGDAVDWLAGHPEGTLRDLEALARLRPSAPTTSSLHADLRSRPNWPELSEGALYGLVGEIVRAIEPHTESDSAAILVQALTVFGIYAGRNCYVRVEGDRHFPNLFSLIVGNTSKGRKGTSLSRVRQVFDSASAPVPILSGLSSGEGLKWQVRDPVTKEGEGGDSGATDKRVMVAESEFAQVLRTVERSGNTLSATVREAWDSGYLRTLTRNDPITATDAHIGIVGHITVDELRAGLHQTDRANGFANRFLFVCARRSKVLPFGGNQLDLSWATRRIEKAAMESRQHAGLREMDREARAL